MITPGASNTGPTHQPRLHRDNSDLCALQNQRSGLAASGMQGKRRRVGEREFGFLHNVVLELLEEIWNQNTPTGRLSVNCLPQHESIGHAPYLGSKSKNMPSGMMWTICCDIGNNVIGRVISTIPVTTHLQLVIGDVS